MFESEIAYRVTIRLNFLFEINNLSSKETLTLNSKQRSLNNLLYQLITI